MAGVVTAFFLICASVGLRAIEKGSPAATELVITCLH